MQMDGDQSNNIEDRRSERRQSGGGGGIEGGGFPIPMGGGGGGLFKGGFGLVAFVVIAMIMGADPGAILSDIAGGGGGTCELQPPRLLRCHGRPAAQPGLWFDRPSDAERAVRLARAEEHRGRVARGLPRTWAASIASPSWCCSATPRAPSAASARRRWARSIARPTSGSISTSASSTSWRAASRAPGQFPQAYVIAHEIGHHVQKPARHLGQGAADAPEHEQARRQRAVGRAPSSRPDCFAGVWANRADKQRGGRMIDDKDVDQALAAASGDRRRRAADARRRVASCPTALPTAPARNARRWFRMGLRRGDPRRCDTFRAQQL